MRTIAGSARFIGLYSTILWGLLGGIAHAASLDTFTTDSDPDFLPADRTASYARGNFSDGVNLFAVGGVGSTSTQPGNWIVRKFDGATGNWVTVDQWIPTGGSFANAYSMVREPSGYYWVFGYGRGGSSAFGTGNERWLIKRSCDTTGDVWPTNAQPTCASGQGTIIQYAYDAANSRDTWVETNQSLTIDGNGALYVTGTAHVKSGNNNYKLFLVRRCASNCTLASSWQTVTSAGPYASATGGGAVYYEPVTQKLYAAGYANNNQFILRKSSNGTNWTDVNAPFRFRGVNGSNIYDQQGIRGLVKDGAGNLYAYGSATGSDAKPHFIVWKATYNAATNDHVFPENMSNTIFEDYLHNGLFTYANSATIDGDGNVFFVGAVFDSATRVRSMLVRRLANGGSFDPGAFEIWSRSGGVNGTLSLAYAATLDAQLNVVISGYGGLKTNQQMWQSRKILYH